MTEDTFVILTHFWRKTTQNINFSRLYQSFEISTEPNLLNRGQRVLITYHIFFLPEVLYFLIDEDLFRYGLKILC